MPFNSQLWGAVDFGLQKINDAVAAWMRGEVPMNCRDSAQMLAMGCALSCLVLALHSCARFMTTSLMHPFAWRFLAVRRSLASSAHPAVMCVLAARLAHFIPALWGVLLLTLASCMLTHACNRAVPLLCAAMRAALSGIACMVRRPSRTRVGSTYTAPYAQCLNELVPLKWSLAIRHRQALVRWR